MTGLPLLLIALSVAALSSAVGAQPTFRAGVDGIELDASVMRNGQPVAGLTARDFVVSDNGVAQDVTSVMLADLPLDLTLVLDLSQSMAGPRLLALVRAADQLSRSLRAGDRLSVISFSHGVHLDVPLTDDLDQVRQALHKLEPGGATALRDAVYLGLQSRPRREARALVLVFTDGADTASWLTERDVVETARRTGIVLHAVRMASDPFLSDLVDAAGGRTWSGTSERQLQELFTTALQEMRARYLLTYSLAGTPKPGWHDVEVRLRTGGAEIRVRPGYLVGPPEP